MNATDTFRASVRKSLSYRHRDPVKLLIDLCLIMIAAAWVWFVSFGQVHHPGPPLAFISVVVFARLGIYFALRLHRASWRDISRFDVLWLSVSAAAGPPAIGLIFLLLPDPFTLSTLVQPYLVLVTEPTTYLLLLCGVRVSVRAAASTHPRTGKRRMLIVGTRDAARSFAYQIQESSVEYRVIGFVDDDPTVQGRRIRGLPVLGMLDDLCWLADEHRLDLIVIAFPSLAPDRLRRVLEVCEPTGVPIRILPSLKEVMGGHADFTSLREVEMGDLLPRSEVRLDQGLISSFLQGKSVLVTGGGGSIGGELCRQALAGGVSKLLILGRGENSIFEMMQELTEQNGHCQLIPVICDVRDRNGLSHVFDQHRPQLVFHAAAHKHVPLMEQYPAEAIKNNVLGTLNVAELSVEHGVERFVLVSTDKAVDPRSVMGASKRIAELVVSGHATHFGANMVSVRFGNVLGSRGSVVPTMKRQIKLRQPITLTDPDMVRYFMTIPEAVQLILQAGASGGAGEVFVLNMGQPMRIFDLARDLVRLSGLVPYQDIPIRITGRRPGEKISEDLLTRIESEQTEKGGQFYIAPSQPVNLTELRKLIDDLRVAAEANVRDDVLALMRGIIPSFTPDAAASTHEEGADRLVIDDTPITASAFASLGGEAQTLLRVPH
jgi:FlaA1/EpsC-like NDP-sugar epimerase